ncbi:RdgB/HAM1 family non-canonical purine NTP pyrophosphatase [Reinekea sp.]|uniref:RdgB/HAM1 family non-canonical purine NTP pyrophosphatase n=1 Tax=Reinekea sp. TaxID=1970455 RepID=UPI002A801DF9|nr:RdgB/HAM1 family non-canonical purine NTP pyrophosphatase [Reinekea sp.]
MYCTNDWVLASNNAGKLREFNQLLAPLAINIQPQAELDVPDAIEDGLSFIENALIKARHAARLTGLPALADDSGLEVDALHGAPGIYSARYASMAGGVKSDLANMDKLLADLKDVPTALRTARFHCVLAFMRHAEDPTPIVIQGTWEGTLLEAPAGDDGFGYDPIFWVASHQCSSAQLTKAEKNRLSHRGQAVSAFSQRMALLLGPNSVQAGR